MPAANQRLGEYVLLDRIAVGAFGEVWRARHHAWSDQIVAVKIPTDPLYVRNLQKEGFAIQRLSHPCIVTPISFDPYAAPAYLVMEYVPGCSLRQLILQGPMTISDAVAVMKQVLAALHQAHHSGIVCSPRLEAGEHSYPRESYKERTCDQGRR
jgi:eukaryotic-like serine/threonine-protein kinase